MEFLPITRDRLAQMQGILSRSAGYFVSIEDEVSHFNQSQAKSWVAGFDSDGRCPCFIRHFEQADNWSMGEIFVSPEIRDRGAVAKELLERFQTRVRFPKGHRLRFDVMKSDESLNRALGEAGYSERKQLFRHFEFSVEELAERPMATSECLPEGLLSFDNEVADVLSHLHPVSGEDVCRWIKNGTIRVVRAGTAIAAAAQISCNDDSVEVLRFATHARFVRQGYGQELLQRILEEAKGKKFVKVTLKVEDTRLSAIGLYRKVGFREEELKAQIWHSRWY